MFSNYSNYMNWNEHLLLPQRSHFLFTSTYLCYVQGKEVIRTYIFMFMHHVSNMYETWTDLYSCIIHYLICTDTLAMDISERKLLVFFGNSWRFPLRDGRKLNPTPLGNKSGYMMEPTYLCIPVNKCCLNIKEDAS